MLHILRHKAVGALSPNKFIPRNNQVRYFWEYVNMMFNKPDTDRIKKFGPDRACAEWVLRNGGKIVWTNGSRISDYNLLPPETLGVPNVLEIDGSDSSISHYGFPHLMGCIKLNKIILHNDDYIDDRAIKGLKYGRSTLTHVQVSKCVNVTDAGLKEIRVLKKLQHLVLFNLISVENLQECKQIIQAHLPNCKIQDGDKIEV